MPEEKMPEAASEETVFSKIIRKEIPAHILYQDDLVTAFRDIEPQRPTHVLIVPNRVHCQCRRYRDER